jgi:hypothetical protein
MNLIVTIYTALLFFILTPGVLVTLPKHGKKHEVLIVHAILFALIWHFTHKTVWQLSMKI